MTGKAYGILRADDEIFQKFGQVYATTASGRRQAWHYHKIQTDNFTCVEGRMRLASMTRGKIPRHTRK